MPTRVPRTRARAASHAANAAHTRSTARTPHVTERKPFSAQNAFEWGGANSSSAVPDAEDDQRA
jgi:hypothetical protein